MRKEALGAPIEWHEEHEMGDQEYEHQKIEEGRPWRLLVSHGNKSVSNFNLYQSETFPFIVYAHIKAINHVEN